MCLESAHLSISNDCVVPTGPHGGTNIAQMREIRAGLGLTHLECLSGMRIRADKMTFYIL